MMNNYEVATALATVVTALAAVAAIIIVRGAAGRLVDALGPARDPQDRSIEENLQYGRFAMECLVTLAVLLVSLYVIVGNSGSSDSQKWASGVVGAVVGYWLKGSNNGHRHNGAAHHTVNNGPPAGRK